MDLIITIVLTFFIYLSMSKLFTKFFKKEKVGNLRHVINALIGTIINLVVIL